jgi:hypothetical protein
MGEVHPIADQIPASDSKSQAQSQPHPVKPPIKAKNKTQKPAQKERGKLTKILPTDRMAFPKQLDVLRAYAAIHASTSKVVTNHEVAAMLKPKLQPSTISMANPFLASIGLLEKAEGGYTPSSEVCAFLRAYEWNSETAAHQLAPLLKTSWFGQAILPMVTFSSISEKEAIEKLGQASSAGPEYRVQIRCLLEYLSASGLIDREGGQLKSVKPTALAVDGSVKNGRLAETGSAPPVEPAESARINTGFAQSPEGAIQFHISIRVGMSEFGGWAPDRIAAFMSGIAQILAAKADVEQKR